jgi:glyoxylase-like metal-dependent hydrolase (beta-lactamase superfamily II)
MIVERALHEQFLSNTYLVADGQGGPAFFVDAGGPVEPLIAAAERLDLAPTDVLLTHNHFDHISETASLCKRWPGMRVAIHPAELEGAPALSEMAHEGGSVQELAAGEALRFGALEVRPLHTPGHTAGMLSFLVFEPDRQPRGSSRFVGPGGFQGGDAAVFTGDTLFRGSVGGVRAPGHTTYTDLKDSIMGTLMELPPQTVVYPGHTDSTTVGIEWDANPFIRMWRGLDPEGAERCTALDEPATLILLADDYDGGKKAWVRWEDGRDDIVPGSRVEPVA